MKSLSLLLVIFTSLFFPFNSWSLDCAFVLKQIPTQANFHNGHLKVVKEIVSALNVEEITAGEEFKELTKEWNELYKRANKNFKKTKNQSDYFNLNQNQKKSLELGRQEGSKTLKSGFKIQDREKIFVMDSNKARESWNEAESKMSEFLKTKQEINFDSLVWLNNILRRGEPHVADFAYSSVFMVRPGKAGVARGDGERALSDVINWYNLNKDQMHPIALAALTAQRLVSYHPFAEANGRTSRLLVDWILMKNGYPPATWTELDYNNFVLEVSPKKAIQNTTQAVKRSLDILGLKSSK